MASGCNVYALDLATESVKVSRGRGREREREREGERERGGKESEFISHIISFLLSPSILIQDIPSTYTVSVIELEKTSFLRHQRMAQLNFGVRNRSTRLGHHATISFYIIIILVLLIFFVDISNQSTIQSVAPVVGKVRDEIGRAMLGGAISCRPRHRGHGHCVM